MNGKFLLFGRDEIANSLMRFVDRKIGEQRGDQRRLAEQRTTKHRIQAKNRASPTRAVIALLDDFRCSPSRNSTGKL
jgi:hypothetical protein